LVSDELMSLRFSATRSENHHQASRLWGGDHRRADWRSLGAAQETVPPIAGNESIDHDPSARQRSGLSPQHPGSAHWRLRPAGGGWKRV